MLKIFISRTVLVFLFPAMAVAQNNAKSEEPPTVDSKALFQLWASFKTPSPGPSEPIGSASAGCLQGGTELPQVAFSTSKKMKVSRQPYVIMKYSRHRFFGLPSLIKVIKAAGDFALENKISPLLIGDMSQNRGGPLLSGHASHQTGLDVDIRFHLPLRNIKPQELETLSAPSFVVNNKEIQKNWSSKQTQILEFFANNNDVDRIFVNPVIKKYLCEQTKSADWLRKLRPWWGHHEHFHVRLKCPEESKLCQGQEKLPEGNGCSGADLNWWFSEEARLELEKRNQTPPSGKVFPRLPDACQALLRP